MRFEIEVAQTTTYVIDDEADTIYALEGSRGDIQRLTVLLGQERRIYPLGVLPWWFRQMLADDRVGELLESAREHGCEVREEER